MKTARFPSSHPLRSEKIVITNTLFVLFWPTARQPVDLERPSSNFKWQKMRKATGIHGANAIVALVRSEHSKQKDSPQFSRSHNCKHIFVPICKTLAQQYLGPFIKQKLFFLLSFCWLLLKQLVFLILSHTVTTCKIY